MHIYSKVLLYFISNMPLDVSAFEMNDMPETQVFKLDVNTY